MKSAAILLLLAIASFGAERPKIGLALEGGGALGIGHIGVLQWFEQNHIPIDYIAGVSMGALVGGFYATGMSPEDVLQITSELDWDQLLSRTVPNRDLTFRRKQDRRAYPTTLEIGLKRGLHIPNGLNGGHQIGLLFDRVALPYSEMKSFDELPTPYRCVATDLLSGKAIVFKEGDLSTAFHATMAIPAVFTPVERDGQLLADGGLVNNLPTGVVKQMGADVVIAVHFDIPPPADMKAAESLVGVARRAIRVMILSNELRSLADADIVITVPTGNHDSFDFKSSLDIVKNGREGAGKRAAVLRKFALPDAEWLQYVAARQAKRRREARVPRSVVAAGTSKEAADSIAHSMAGLAGKPVDRVAVETAANRILGEGRYESVGYSLRKQGDEAVLRIDAREKYHGPPFLMPGLDFNASDLDNVRFQIGARFLMLDLGGYRSELRTDISVGFQPSLSMEYYRPLKNSNWFVAPRALYERTLRNVYEHGKRVSDYRTLRASFGTDVGYTFGRSAEFRLGYQLDRLSSGLRIGELVSPASRGVAHTTQARFVFDNQDNSVVPREGSVGSLSAMWRHSAPLAAGQFPQLETNLSKFWRSSTNGSAFWHVAGGATLLHDAPEVNKFSLGGPFRLSALGLEEMRGNHYAYSGLGYLHRIASMPSIAGKGIFAMTRYEVGKVYGSLEPRGWFHDGSTGLLMETVLGPFFVGGSVGEMGRRKVFFALGRVF